MVDPGMAVHCLKWLELAVNGSNRWMWLKMVGNGWKWLEWQEMARNG